MSANSFFPSLPAISRETIAVLAATLLAAYVISQFPAVKKFVQDNR